MRLHRRIGRGSLIGLAALVALDGLILGANALGLRINATASMPLGVYRVAPMGQARLVRGTLVAICHTGEALRVALSRGYLRPGPCRGNVEPLLKRVAAVAGDAVAVSDAGVRVNGSVLPNSGRVARHCNDRPVPRIPAGTYRMPAGTVWLFAPVARSWDSRYYGPQMISNVVGIATPLLLVGAGRPCG